MDSQPLICIVTPSYNQGRFIRQTIESVLSQNYPNFEYWVIDGGSSDETLSILKSFSNPRFHWLSEPDKGQSNAINKGLARCGGELFNWINSDDYLESGTLSKVADAARVSGSNILSGKLRKLDDQTGQTNGYYALEVARTAEETLALGRFCQPSTFWRTSVFKRCGPVREDLHCAMDFYLWARYLVSHGIGSITTTDDILAHYREHSASKSARLNAQFKDEINGIFAELLKSLGAPPFLTEHFTQFTSLPVPDVVWEAGSHFEPKRLFAILCFQVARKLYYERACAASRQWLQRSLAFQPSLRALRFYMKLLFKKSG
jgi:glycosyltransferase involved in cell wall biosynthesis